MTNPKVFIAVEGNIKITAKAIEDKWNFNLQQENKIKVTELPIDTGELMLSESEIVKFSVDAVTGDGKVGLNETNKLTSRLVQLGAKWCQEKLLAKFTNAMAQLKAENEKYIYWGSQLESELLNLKKENERLKKVIANAHNKAYTIHNTPDVFNRKDIRIDADKLFYILDKHINP